MKPAYPVLHSSTQRPLPGQQAKVFWRRKSYRASCASRWLVCWGPHQTDNTAPWDPFSQQRWYWSPLLFAHTQSQDCLGSLMGTGSWDSFQKEDKLQESLFKVRCCCIHASEGVWMFPPLISVPRFHCFPDCWPHCSINPQPLNLAQCLVLDDTRQMLLLLVVTLKERGWVSGEAG